MKEYSSKAFGRTVQRIRKEQKLSQETLSSAVGVTRSHLSNIENGKVDPGIATVWRIAVNLNMEPCELLRLVAKELSEKG